MFRLFAITLLVLCLVMNVLAGEPAPPKVVAVVTGGGSTTVSGTIVVDKMAAFPEDDVETHSEKMASLTFGGNTMIVLGNSHVRLHAAAADLLSGGTVVTTSTRFTVQSSCLSAQPIAMSNSKYSVVPYQGRIYIHAEQGDVLVKARRELRVPSGKTAVISSCGKPGEILEFASGSNLPYQIVFGSAVAAGVIVITQPMSSESPKPIAH